MQPAHMIRTRRNPRGHPDFWRTTLGYRSRPVNSRARAIGKRTEPCTSRAFAYRSSQRTARTATVRVSRDRGGDEAKLSVGRRAVTIGHRPETKTAPRRPARRARKGEAGAGDECRFPLRSGVTCWRRRRRPARSAASAARPALCRRAGRPGSRPAAWRSRSATSAPRGMRRSRRPPSSRSPCC